MSKLERMTPLKPLNNFYNSTLQTNEILFYSSIDEKNHIDFVLLGGDIFDKQSPSL